MAGRNADAADFCARLRRNDPDIVAITRELAREHSYIRIGQALNGNTHVSFISIDLHCLMCAIADDGGETKQARPILKYIRESAVLRTLDVWELGFADGSRFPHGRSANYKSSCACLTAQVLHAVLKNQEQAKGCSLEELYFSPWYSSQSSEEALTQFLETSKSLRRLTIHRDDDSGDIAWLGHALRSAYSLEHLEVCSMWSESSVEVNCTTILSSLASHPHPRIQTLDLGCFRVIGPTLQALVDLMRRAGSLRHVLGGYFPQELTAEDAKLFTDALRDNQGSLTILFLQGKDSPQFLAALVAYFKSTASLQNNLQMLNLGRFSLDGMAESMEIRGSVGSSLRVFSADGRPTANNGRPDVVRFLNTLASQGSRNKLEKLFLFNLVDENATAALANCLPRLVNLVELNVNPYRLVDDEVHAVVNGPLVAYFQSTASPQNSLRTLHHDGFSLDGMAESMVESGSVGSALRVFHTSGRRPDFVRFVNTMASQGYKNKLEGLHVDDLDENDTKALTACLPNLVNLVELDIKSFNFGDDIECNLVKALKRNGSLVTVSVEPELGHRYQEHAKAICDRNEQMPLLLGRRPSASDTSAAATNPPEEDIEAETAADNHAIAAAAAAKVTTRMKLVPSLFAAALDTPRMTPHMMLMGLGNVCAEKTKTTHAQGAKRTRGNN